MQAYCGLQATQDHENDSAVKSGCDTMCWMKTFRAALKLAAPATHAAGATAGILVAAAAVRQEHRRLLVTTSCFAL